MFGYEASRYIPPIASIGLLIIGFTIAWTSSDTDITLFKDAANDNVGSANDNSVNNKLYHECEGLANDIEWIKIQIEELENQLERFSALNSEWWSIQNKLRLLRGQLSEVEEVYDENCL